MKIKLNATVCTQDHGGESNAATVYGHHGSTRVCTRVKGTDTWVYDLIKQGGRS